MKTTKILLLICVISLETVLAQENIHNTTDPYLNLKTPGIVAKEFPSNTLIQKDWGLEGVSPDMKDVYLTSSHDIPFFKSVIVFHKDESKYNVWNKYNFNAASNRADKILYCKTKYIERTDTGWSEIKSLGPMFEREDWGIMRLTASNKGTIVFDDYKNNDVIRISAIKDGKRERPRLLGKEINTGKFTCHPFIAPDDSYLIWDSEREGGFGGTDLYISFRQENGSWGPAINMGENINSEIEEGGATLTPDGKYLLFGRVEEKTKEDGSKYWTKEKRYWVSTQVIENLRLKQ